jgi:hypothetical protein
LHQIAAACESLKQRGFINYFGLQRFGTGGSPTHKVGAGFAALLLLLLLLLLVPLLLPLLLLLLLLLLCVSCMP